MLRYGIAAFYNCTNLSYISISPNITQLEQNCFKDCNKLPPVTLSLPSSSPLSDCGTTNFGSSITIFFFSVEGDEATLTQATFGGSSWDSWDIRIPAVFDGKPVTRIAANVFSGDAAATLSLPSSIRGIDNYAFTNCPNLNATVYTQGMEIGESAFENCPGVKLVQGTPPPPTPTPIPTPTATPQPAPSQDPNPVSDFTYTIAGNEVTITDYLGSSANVNVPAAIEGLPVTVIGPNSFDWNSKLLTVSLPSTVHTIGDRAFDCCSNLTAVYGTENVTSYGEYAFMSCSRLSYLYVSDNLVEVGYGAFQNCSLLEMTLSLSESCSLPKYFIHGSSTTVYVFSAEGNDATLVSFYTNEDTLRIPACAFANCTSLASITLPDSITSIGLMAFQNCTSLTSINIPPNAGVIATCVFEGSGIYTEAVKRVVAKVITSDMSDFEKALALHDWIIYNAYYDAGSPCFHGAEGVLHYGRGVCQSYEEAYGKLLDEVGIANYPVYGIANGGSHSWNLVQLDGEWYHVDCTLDDPLPDGYECHSYFGLTDELISTDHFNYQADYLPAANGTRYQYGKDNGVN